MTPERVGGAGDSWRDWRPMPFGSRRARTIRDPVLEPLWPGWRVLVHVAHPGSGRATIEIVDEAGLALAGHPDIQEALAAAARAAHLVLDGYLVDLPRRDAAGIFGGHGAVPVPGLSATARQLVVGGRGVQRPTSARASRAEAAPALGPSPDAAESGPAAGLVAGFVAVDLLALDGEALLDVPLLERKRLLDSGVAPGELVRRGPHVRPPGTHWYGQWRAFGFREIAVKSANSRYHPGRPSEDWAIAALPRG